MKIANPKIGIGVLSWAHGHVNIYANQISQFDDVHLVACWDDDVKRGQRNAADFGIGYCANLDALLSNPEVQCVIVASETNKHADLCAATANAGKPILLQKPMPLTLVDF